MVIRVGSHLETNEPEVWQWKEQCVLLLAFKCPVYFSHPQRSYLLPFHVVFCVFSFIDLGPISLNWFEELSAEAPPYEPKSFGEVDGPSGWLDQTPFKTPRAKPSTYSQLASTPLLFKEQNAILPPCSSPEKEPDQKKIGARE